MYRPFIFILQIQKYYSNDTFVLHCKNSMWMFYCFGVSIYVDFGFFRTLDGVTEDPVALNPVPQEGHAVFLIW